MVMPMGISDILFDGPSLITYRSHATSLSQPSDIPIPIAIIGVGMRLPGGCHDAETFWDFLMDDTRPNYPLEF